MVEARVDQDLKVREGVSDGLIVALPESALRLDQDAEWCVIRDDRGWREVRFHDYGDLYEVPGLYERLFYGILKCKSPKVVSGLLQACMAKTGRDARSMRVLDLGAGNGMVGEELGRLGSRYLVGIDIIPEARDACERDRPGVYEDYFVTDMTALADAQRQDLGARKFNCLTCVAALGFGDIPAKAFVEAWNLIEDGGAVTFNIRDRFLGKRDSSGFARLIQQMIEDGSLEITERKRYRHRLATNGSPLYYVGLAGLKHRDVTEIPS